MWHLIGYLSYPCHILLRKLWLAGSMISVGTFHWLEIINVTFDWIHVLPMRHFITIIVIGWIYDIGWYISLDGYCKCCFSLAFICGSWKILGFTIQERHISESYLTNMPTMPTPSPRQMCSIPSRSRNSSIACSSLKN